MLYAPRHCFEVLLPFLVHRTTWMQLRCGRLNARGMSTAYSAQVVVGMSLQIAGKSAFCQEEADRSMTFSLCSMKAGTTILVQGWGGD